MENLEKHGPGLSLRHQAVAVVNTTKKTEDFISWWQGEDSFFAKVEALLLVCTLLCAIRVVFGWWRRCSSNVLIKYSVWLAYTITPLVAIYTLGFIGSSIHEQNNGLKDLVDEYHLFVWSLPLASALGGTYGMTAYNVDDNNHYTRHLVRQALYVLNMASVAMLEDKLAIVTWILLFLFMICPQSILNAYTNMVASSSSDKESLYLHDYMKREHLNTASYDPVTLQGYNYIVFRSDRTKLACFLKINTDITVSGVWRCKEGILGSSGGSDGTRLKEVCLSYALSRLLRRRFSGASCPESKHQMMHDLVFQGLLSNVEDNYQAAYRVIDTELAFTHDHFFTTNPFWGPLIVGAALGNIIAYLAYVYITISRSQEDYYGDNHIMMAVIVLVLLAIELLQLYIFLSSDFARVILALFSFAPSKGAGNFWFQTLRVGNKFPQLFGCWQNKIGQHSLLKDLHSRSVTSDVMGSLSWIGKVLLPPAFPRGIYNPGVKGSDRIPLTNRVKKAIAWTLKSSDGHLSNGASSLQRNGEPQLSQEFLLGSHASDLLIWHIATEYCDMAQYYHQAVKQVDFTCNNRYVAATLSSYCAYLMAFVPELLPDYQLETTAMFHQARKAALQHLQKEKTLEEKYEKLNGDINGQPPPQNMNLSDEPGIKIFKKGIQLGKRLEGIMGDDKRWKILADFWTEMILYIAPSSNAKDHIQHLANGGEFLTHLWALLTHAGILERGQQNVFNVQNAGAANLQHQDQANRVQPDQPHTEDTQNPVNLQEIGATNISGGQEADRGAHVHGYRGFSDLPDQCISDSTASRSRNDQPRVEIV